MRLKNHKIEKYGRFFFNKGQNTFSPTQKAQLISKLENYAWNVHPHPFFDLLIFRLYELFLFDQPYDLALWNFGLMNSGFKKLALCFSAFRSKIIYWTLPKISKLTVSLLDEILNLIKSCKAIYISRNFSKTISNGSNAKQAFYNTFSQFISFTSKFFLQYFQFHSL